MPDASSPAEPVRAIQRHRAFLKILGGAVGLAGLGHLAAPARPAAADTASSLTVSGYVFVTNAPANGNPLMVQADNSTTAPAQVVVQGATASGKQLLVGYRTDLDYGAIQAVWQGNSYRPLSLNPLGGRLGVGTTAPVEALDVVGNIRLSGTLIVNGVAAIDSAGVAKQAFYAP